MHEKINRIKNEKNRRIQSKYLYLMILFDIIFQLISLSNNHNYNIYDKFS